MTVRRPYVVHCRLTFNEFMDLKDVCAQHNLTMQDMLRAMIVDAVAEEQIDALRRQRQTGSKGCSESSKGCGATTP